MLFKASKNVDKFGISFRFGIQQSQYVHIGLKISEICSKKDKKDDCYFTILGCSEDP